VPGWGLEVVGDLSFYPYILEQEIYVEQVPDIPCYLTDAVDLHGLMIAQRAVEHKWRG
jgi:hypothetical protein